MTIVLSRAVTLQICHDADRPGFGGRGQSDPAASIAPDLRDYKAFIIPSLSSTGIAREHGFTMF
jgi:hypothetical protein